MDQTETKGAYDAYVKKGTNGVTQQQAKMALTKLGVKPKPFEIEYFWFEKDKTSEEDTITYEEFENLRSVVNTDPKKSLYWAFNKFDTDRNGTIDKHELKKLLVLMYEDTDGEWVDDDFVTDCLKLADINNDGVLQIEEFITMIIQRMGN